MHALAVFLAPSNGLGVGAVVASLLRPFTELGLDKLAQRELRDFCGVGGLVDAARL